MLALAGLVSFGISLGAAPGAAAEQPNIYGVVTADEAREISAGSASTCATLRRSAATAFLTPDDVSLLVDGYLGDGWDLESTGDILRESVDRNCGEYLPQVARAISNYGPVA